MKQFEILMKYSCNKMIHFIVAMYNFVIIFRLIEVSSTML